MSNLNLARIKSYDDAVRFLGNKSDRLAGHNTRVIRRDDGVIYVRYHESPVVEFYPRELVDSGPVTVLNACGWRTYTTKERLNAFCPEGFYVYQERGNWYLAKHGKRSYVFQDGITIDRYGNVYNAGDDAAEDHTKQVIKQIKAYVDGYIKALLSGNVPAPSGGDCWYCLMVTDSGQSLGDATHNVDHLDNHFEESYYVPSMLVNAVKQYPMSLFAKSTIGKIWESGAGDVSKWEQDILSRDVKSVLTRYLKHEFGIAS